MPLPIAKTPFVKLYHRGDRRRPPLLGFVTEPQTHPTITEVQVMVPRTPGYLRTYETVLHIDDPRLNDPRVAEQVAATWEEWPLLAPPQPAIQQPPAAQERPSERAAQSERPQPVAAGNNRRDR